MDYHRLAQREIFTAGEPRLPQDAPRNGSRRNRVPINPLVCRAIRKNRARRLWPAFTQVHHAYPQLGCTESDTRNVSAS